MNWLLTQLGHLIGSIVGLIFAVAGFLFQQILRVAVNRVILPLLKATIFHPLTLNTNDAMGHALQILWATSALVSAGIALLMLSAGVFSRLALSWTGSKSWGEIGEGLMVWMVVLVGGWFFLGLLLNISDVATLALVHSLSTTFNTAFFAPNAGLGIVSIATASFMTLLWPLTGLIMVILLIWAVGVWLMRQVDLVIFAGLMPVMAALGVGGNKVPFKWAWTEAMGAVFNQLAMAVILWIGTLFLATPLHSGFLGFAHLHTLKDLLRIGLACTTFTMAARAPQLLGNLTGHRSAGASHVMAAAALGYLGGRGIASAAKASPAGAAASKAMEGAQSRAQEQASGWSGRPSLGEKLGQTTMGQAVSAKMDALGQTRGGQALQRVAQHPLAKAAGRGINAVTKPARTMASMAYQPMATLGRMTSQGIADSNPNGRAGTLARSRDATMLTAELGVGAAASQLFGDGKAPAPGTEIFTHARQANQLAEMTNSNIYMPVQNVATGDTEWKTSGEIAAMEGPRGLAGYGYRQLPGEQQYDIQFAKGSQQGTIYDNAKTSVLNNIPIVRSQSSFTNTHAAPPKPVANAPHAAGYSIH